MRYLIAFFMGFIVTVTVLTLSGCADSHRQPTDYFCTTPGGGEHFTAPQAKLERFHKELYITVTNPGTGQKVYFPFTARLMVYMPNDSSS